MPPQYPQFPRPLALPVLRQGCSFAVFGKRGARKSPASRRQGQGLIAPTSPGRIRRRADAERMAKKRAQPQWQLEGGPKHSTS